MSKGKVIIMSTLVDIPMPSRFRIGELFQNNNFMVPLYQRNYAWQNSEIVDFWEDLLDLVEDKRNSHFFGQIVTYKNESGSQEIIDGQQRLTTSTIFMAAIRDIAQKMYDDNFKGSQDESNLELGDSLRDIKREVNKTIRGMNGEESSLMVQQNSKNQEQNVQTFFLALTHSDIKVRDEKTNSEPKKNMQHAYKDITQWINSYLKQYKQLNERIAKLQLIFESFFSNFYIVMISAPSRKDAFTIFETLNSRGKDLMASDIIKNHLMSLMGEDIQEGNEKWNKLTEKLDNNSNRITRFIRTYWASKKRIVPESKLYREVSAEVNNLNEAQVFLDDLDKLVDLYTVLESPTSPKANYDFFANKQVTQGIDILNRLNVKLYYPIVMAMYYNNYSQDGMLKVITKITSVFIRHRTIINDGTNKLETGFSDIARKIWNLELKNIEDINLELNKKLLPSSEATKASFTVLKKSGGQRGAKKWTLVYLLSELYGTEYGDFEDGYYSSVFNDDDYRLVQISLDPEIGDHREFVGNWVLIEKSLSKNEFKNEAELADKLTRSKLSGNKKLAQVLNSGKWSKENIIKRQNSFADDATVIW